MSISHRAFVWVCSVQRETGPLSGRLGVWQLSAAPALVPDEPVPIEESTALQHTQEHFMIHNIGFFPALLICWIPRRLIL